MAETSAVLFWTLHTFLLGGYQAAIVNTVSLIRSVLYLKIKPALAKYFVGASILLASAIVLPSVIQLYEILPLIASSFYGVSLIFQDNSKIVRLACLMCDFLWMSYAIMLGSIPLALSCAIGMLSGVIGFIRHERTNFNTLSLISESVKKQIITP